MISNLRTMTAAGQAEWGPSTKATSEMTREGYRRGREWPHNRHKRTEAGPHLHFLIFGGIHSKTSGGPRSDVIVPEGDLITTIPPTFSATSGFQLQPQSGTPRRGPRPGPKRRLACRREAQPAHDLPLHGRAGQVHSRAGGGPSELKTSPFT